VDIAFPSIDASAFVARSALVSGRVVLRARSVVMFGVVIRAEADVILVGEETNVQDNAVLHCDDGAPCLVGRRVTIGHSAIVHGASIGDRALVGMGAIVLNRATIGEGAWLGAGSVVPEGETLPAWTLAVGSPARPLRELTVEEIERADRGVTHYLELGEAYRRHS